MRPKANITLFDHMRNKLEAVGLDHIGTSISQNTVALEARAPPGQKKH